MPLRIASAERGGTFWTQAEALRIVLEREGLGPVEILETKGASVETAERLGSGGAELGFMAANWVPRAVRGEAPFQAPLALRIVAPMNTGPLFFIARGDGPLRRVRDLGDRRVVFGPQKSGMAQHAALILGLLDVAVAPVYLDFGAGAEALAAGETDAQLQCPIPNRVMTALCQRIRVRVLRYEAGELERVLAAVPYYRRAVMEPGALPGLDHESPQPGVLNVLVAPASADAELTARIRRAIECHAAELAVLNPLYRGLDALLRTERNG